ncbi:MAG: 3-phosphoserine/phosphohydroxythreonine transaminase [Kiritimatiellae bacterium]|nr:3-phosphoserine/phosphohydroxythreonine transaminase [Kiritimatiellia bacterium]
MARVYNFNAGPAVLPVEVLEEARDQMIEYQASGMSLLESSHRGKEYDAVHAEAVANYRSLLNCSDDYAVCFVAGGASLQFAMIPLNFLGAGQTADYANSGAWAAKAVKEAAIVGKVNIAANTAKDIPTRVPAAGDLKLTGGAAYVHITSNETISGAQWKSFPATESPLVADMSSDILSRPFDINQFGLIYAGAQKNLGPSGLALVVIRKDLAERGADNLPAILKYKTFIAENSLYNTPPCFSIYIMMLVSRWMLKKGLENIYRGNREKAAKIYGVIDKSGFYKGTAARECRSDMNVTFRLPSEGLEEQFVKEASKHGMKGLKGHRSVGGIRASIYNAFPPEGVDALAAFMREFERKNG